MANLPVQNLIGGGIEPIYNAASASGDEFVNDGKTFLHIKNGGTLTINVTFPAQTPFANKPGFGKIPLQDKVVSIQASGEAMIEFLRPAIFNGGNGRVEIRFDDITNVTVGVFSTPRIS